MSIVSSKMLGRASLSVVLLAAITACSATGAHAAAAANGWHARPFVDAAMIPGNVNRDDVFVTNRGDAGN
jgi:hypothetical protein